MKQSIWKKSLYLLVITTFTIGLQIACASSSNQPVKTIRINLPTDKTVSADALADLIAKQIQLRCPAIVKTSDEADYVIELSIDKEIAKEGFRIENSKNGSIKIAASSLRGLTYGAGKFLRTSHYTNNGFIPSSWRGTSVPKNPIRGIYFTTHFFNYYHVAPIEEIQDYVEQLALYGYNNVIFWYDTHHFSDINDPNAQEMIKRLKAMMLSGKKLGITGGLGIVSNESYYNGPKQLRAKGKGRGLFYGTEICPSQPGATRYLLNQFKEIFDTFADSPIEHIWVWPYDQGSCSCDKCKPWGSNGFLRISEPICKMAKKHFPGLITTMSTWHIHSDEWEGMNKAFTEKHPDWLDYMMVRLPEDSKLKDYKKKIPGNLPPISFVEISMRGMFPWGGYGANPQHRYLKKTWEPFKNSYHGGFVYSEGIYEDLNKFTIVQLFWNPDQPVEDIVKEYLAYEFTTDKTDQLLEVVDTFEKNLHYYVWDGIFGEFDKDKPLRSHDTSPPKSPNAEKAYEIVKSIDAELSPYVKNSFRWRIMYIRALLDYELKKNAGKPTEKCRPAFDELRKIYYVHKETFWMVRPPLMP